MSEELKPSVFEPNNTELSEAVNKANESVARRESNTGELTPYISTMLTERSDGSLPINKDFNQGVEQGPVELSEAEIEGSTGKGWDLEETKKMLVDEEQARRIRHNSFPFEPVGEQQVVHDALRARAQESRDKARPTGPGSEEE